MGFTYPIDTTTYTSPNTEAGVLVPQGILVHSTEGMTAESSAAWLCNPASRVSAHVVIRDDGLSYELLYENQIAWHGGKYNIYYGIECAHKENNAAGVWTDAQRTSLKEWMIFILRKYPGIPLVNNKAHRTVQPWDRRDPTDWPDEDLYPWIEQVYNEARGIADAQTAYTLHDALDMTLLGYESIDVGAVASRIDAHPNGEYTTADILSIVRSYNTLAQQANVDVRFVLAQMCHETAYLSSWWSQRPRRNPAGIGVTGAPGKGNSYPSWDVAARCHTGRMLAYATGYDDVVPEFQQALIDQALADRSLPKKYFGTFTKIGDGGNGIWATDDQYASKLARMVLELFPHG